MRGQALERLSRVRNGANGPSFSQVVIATPPPRDHTARCSRGVAQTLLQAAKGAREGPSRRTKTLIPCFPWAAAEMSGNAINRGGAG